MESTSIQIGDCVYIIPKQEPPTEEVMQEVYEGIAEVVIELGIENMLNYECR